MSRIHEALKKAKQERDTVQGADVLASSHEPAISSEINSDFSDLSPKTFTDAAPAGDYLRFDDLRTRCVHPEWHLDPNVNVFFNAGLSEHCAEQFRTLRSRLYQIRANQSLRTILVTSSVPGEGKTFVTSNLAQAIIRQPDRRVLIIDGDLRCARLHVPFGAPNAPGLAEYLRGQSDEFAVTQTGPEENLCFIAGGVEVADPSELLSNGRLKSLLDRMAPVFDWILIDSPPCLPVADANILADFCDGVLMVVKAGVTSTETAQRACQELQKRNVVGVVLNSADESHMNSSQYYAGYGYGYGASKNLRN
jgi:protein-tyrosine kinase